jgi:hypothetical protein
MSSCREGPDPARFDAVKAIRTAELASEIEEKLWRIAVEECLPANVFDTTFRVDRKTLVVAALKNIVARLEEI